jgi:hypothetical protein
MCKRLLMTAVATAVLSVAAFAGVRQTADPEESVKAINTWYNDQLKQAREAMKNPDFQALMAERVKRAKEALAGIDTTKVEAPKAFALAQLYQISGQPKEQIEAAGKYLTSNPEPAQKYAAQNLMLGGYVATQDAAGIRKTLSEIKPANAQMAAQLASSTAASYSRVVAEKVGPQAALDLIKQVEALVAYDQLTEPNAKTAGEISILQIASARADLLTKMGKKDEALAALEEGKKKLGPESRYARSLESKINLAKLPGSTAPPIVQERGYGDYKGLDSLRGKVVVLDFTAHW